MEKSKIARTLIIVPHQDDELYIAGSVIYELTNSDLNEVFVLYTTNGDYYSFEAAIRMKEALSALAYLGLKENHVIFLGYGDKWRSDKHIYNVGDDINIVSHAGRTETYALNKHPDYRFMKSGYHNKYNRNNYKQDINDVILDILPKVIITVDLDEHPDHRAVSLLVEECMGEILKKKKEYQPLILKKFAYSGVWRGEDDYYKLPHMPTINLKGSQTDNPIFLWEDRLQFKVPMVCSTLQLSKNILYKAVKQHKSQDGWFSAVRFINDDIVFWRRRSENLALFADIQVTSGEAKYLNDFKMIDSADINSKEIQWKNCAWIPDKMDYEKKAVLNFDTRISVSQITLYENPNSKNSCIEDVLIKFDDDYIFRTGELKHGGMKNSFQFREEHFIKKLTLQIISSTGKEAGLTEIEVFDNLINLAEYNLPLQEYVDGIDSYKKISLMQKIALYIDEKKYRLRVKCLFKFPGKGTMKKQYEILVRHPQLLLIYWLYHFSKKLFNHFMIKNMEKV